jgi:probable F420-dependent oxidoreductase
MKLVFAIPHLLRLKATVQPWEAGVTGADQTRMVKRADELGYDMISTPEHFIIPNDHLELSGPHYFHAAAAQAYFAGATQRILINSSVAILPLQHPIVTAKALATIDWLSSGRTIATFGVGWLEKEFEILGVPFRERGRMADEYLAAMIELWTSDTPFFEGKYVSFRDVAFEPKPVQKPHLPIWIGGDSDAALKRAARFGSGWWPFLTPVKDIAGRIEFIKSQPDFRGVHFEIMYGLQTSRVGEGHVVRKGPADLAPMSAQEIVDGLNRLRELGVTMSSVPIPPMKNADAYLDYAQWVIEEIKPRVH